MTPVTIEVFEIGGLAGELEAVCGALPMSCFQCTKCSSGCPVADRGDLKPHELVRLVQTGQRGEALGNRFIWECTSCHTCVTRCPQKVDIPAMNDALRALSVREGLAPAGTAVPTFNAVFLESVRKRGRVHELSLMATFKLRTRRFFEDVDKAPGMLAKGKLPLRGSRVGGRSGREELFRRAVAEAAAEAAAMEATAAATPSAEGSDHRSGRSGMSYVFYPGCSLEGTAKDFYRSTLAVAAKVGLDLPEIEGWICCGSTAAHNTDPLLADALPARNLQAARGLQVAVACAACYSRLKVANHHISASPAVRARVAGVLGSDYDGLTPVRHLLEILGRDMEAEVAAAVRRPLGGLKVACYYGCLLSRPPEVTQFDDAENPTLMDRLLEIAGATVLDWPHKTECCGASFSITDSSIILDLTDRILAMAQAAGVDCVATACPLCQLNLDMRQKDIAAKRGHRYDLPVFYVTQLLGLAMGCSERELSLDSLFIDPRPLLRRKGLGGAEKAPVGGAAR